MYKIFENGSGKYITFINDRLSYTSSYDDAHIFCEPIEDVCKEYNLGWLHEKGCLDIKVVN